MIIFVIMVKSSHFIADKLVNQPVGFDNVSVNLDLFPNDILQAQPSLNISGLEFTNEAVTVIKDFINTEGLFTKLPYQIKVSDEVSRNGYITNYQINDDKNKILCDFVADESLNVLSDELKAISSLILANDYNLKSHDFVIQKTKEEIKQSVALLTLTLAVSTYIVIQVGKDISDFAADLTDASPLSTLEKILKGVSLLVQTIAISKSNFSAIKEIVELIITPFRRTKVISLYELLDKALQKLDYDLVTNIDDLHNVYHWASRYSDNQDLTVKDRVIQGFIDNQNIDLDVKSPSLFVPNSNDRLENGLEVLKFIQEKYSAWVTVQENNGRRQVIVKHREDDFFKKEASLTLKKSLPLENYRYNTDEHVVSKSINYSTDPKDQWTFEDFKGSHYLVTEQLENFKNSTGKGFVNKNYGLALASRKSKLNDAEKLVESITNTMKRLANLVGGKFDFQLKTRIGASKISDELTSVAKLLYLNSSGKIPSNHRNLLSASNDFITYQWAESFLLNPKLKKVIYEGVRVPFNSNDFKQLLINDRFIKLNDGRIAELRKLEWFQGEDIATATIAIEKDYITKLKLTTYESER